MSKDPHRLARASARIAIALGPLLVAACGEDTLNIWGPKAGAAGVANSGGLGGTSSTGPGGGSGARGGGAGASSGSSGAGGATAGTAGTSAGGTAGSGAGATSGSGGGGTGGSTAGNAGRGGSVSTDGGVGPDSSGTDAGAREDISGGVDAGQSDAGVIRDSFADTVDQSVEPDVAPPSDAPADAPFDWPTGDNAIDGSADAGSISLPFDVRAAEFSRALERIVILSASPVPALHLYDPERLIDRWMQLPFEPGAFGVSYDGTKAVVAGPESPTPILYIDLARLAVISTCSIPRGISSLAVWPEGMATLAAWDSSGSAHALSLDLATCATVDLQMTGPTYGRISPDGNHYYLTIGNYLSKLTSSGGSIQVDPFDVHSIADMCDRVWLSADESRIFGACGERYRAENDFWNTLAYTGRFEGFSRSGHSRIFSMVHTPALHQIALTIDNHLASPTDIDFDPGNLYIYDDLYLGLRRTVPLPNLGTYPNLEMVYHSLFQNVAGTMYYAIGRTTADHLPTNVVRIPTAVGTPDGGSGQGGLGLPYLAGITAPADAALLPYEITDAEYDSTSNRIVFASRRPEHAVHVYDPETRVTTTIALPALPRSIAVRADGQFAAVGHEGWVSYVDLAHASIVWTCPLTTDVGDIVLANNGFIYTFSGRYPDDLAYSIAVSDCSRMQLGRLSSGNPYAKLTSGGDRIFEATNLDEIVVASDGAIGGRHYSRPVGAMDNSKGWARMTSATTFEFIFADGGVEQGTFDIPELVRVGGLQGLGGDVNSVITELLRASWGKLITIPARSWSLPDEDPPDASLEVFDATTYAHDKTVPIPRFYRKGSPLLMHGRFVFERSDGTSYYAVVKSDPIAGVEKDRAFGVIRMTP